MKERILKGWTFTRVLYVVIGVTILIQSVMIRQWTGMALGAYFAVMGIFAFGCAAGNCFGGACYTRPVKTDNRDVIFEEIKTK